MDTPQPQLQKWSHMEVAVLLTSHTALTEVSIYDAVKIATLMYTRPVKKGEVLMQEGTTSNNHMLLILRGECVVENESMKKADSLVLSVVGSGHMIGEMGVFDGEPRSATCKAFTDMEVAVLDKEALTKLIAQEPAVGCKLLAALLHRTSGRLRATNKKLRLLAQVTRTLEREIEALNKPVPSASPAPFTGNPLMS